MKTQTEKEIIEEVKKNTDLHRYPFDEFWFNIGWNKCEEEFNKQACEKIQEWYNDEKTCSGKPHCTIEECDLCVNCFKELLEKFQGEEKSK